MNAIAEFLNEGSIHPTRSSHRTATKSYYAFIEAQRNSDENVVIKFTPPQQQELRIWDPMVVKLFVHSHIPFKFPPLKTSNFRHFR